MNKKTQIVTLGMIGGAIGLGLLANYWLSAKTSKPSPYLDFDELLEKKETATPVKTQDVIKEEKEPKEELVNKVGVHQALPIVSPKEKREETPNDQFPLKLGSQGPRVSRLQVWLLRNYGWTGAVTSTLDEKTANQMKRYLKTDALDEATYQKLKLDAPIQQQKIIR